ncbi:hypothetical protein A0H81_00170 [Grifola frondosa]|uniref:Uncharacterized protein n=1 Tax=Grifola frondosa TaxID=5627 RepID=A0A1C7MR09_GRIFR|nr:hypothetical protein A0H81_00170 [Grifola frondosa]
MLGPHYSFEAYSPHVPINLHQGIAKCGLSTGQCSIAGSGRTEDVISNVLQAGCRAYVCELLCIPIKYVRRGDKTSGCGTWLRQVCNERRASARVLLVFSCLVNRHLDPVAACRIVRCPGHRRALDGAAGVAA